MKLSNLVLISKIVEQSKVPVVFHAEGDNVKHVVDIWLKLQSKSKLKTKVHIHFAHISSKQELDFAKNDQIKGYQIKNQQIKPQKNVTVELTPHHLFLTKSDLKRLGPFGVMKPGLKSLEDQQALWQAIDNNLIDTIGTDHAPHLIEEKKQKEPAFGVPGLETMLPLLLDAFNNNKISLQTIVRLCCENPASIFKIKNKGKIKQGYDADLVIIDLEKKQLVRNQDLLTKCKWSPFNGMLLKGWPITTIVDGNVVYSDGQIYDIKAKEVEYM